MPRSRSQIADLFAQALEAQGFEKQAYPFDEEWTEQGREQSFVNLKDSDPLYNLHHPDQGYEIDENIAHLAHKDPVIIFPSYDRINGLVENINERSSIMQNLALDKPVGLFALNKYATRELTMELIRVANEMDAVNQEEIFKLADACLLQIEKKNTKIKKEAWIWFAAAGAILAAKWLSTHMDNGSHGIQDNAEQAIKALSDLKETSFWEGQVDDRVKADADKIIDLISHFQKISAQFTKIVDGVNVPRTLSETRDYIEHMKSLATEDGQRIQQTVEAFRNLVSEINVAVSDAIKNFTSQSFQQNHKETTWLERITGPLGEAANGRWGLFGNDFQKASNALGTFQKSINELASTTEVDLPKIIDENTRKLEVVSQVTKPKAETHTPTSEIRSKEDDDALSVSMKGSSVQ